MLKARPVQKQVNEITEENLTRSVKCEDTAIGTGAPQPRTTGHCVKQGNIALCSSWFCPIPEAFTSSRLLRGHWGQQALV